MMLILEVLLTIRAWKNGWKALALIPDALALVLGFVLGASLSPGASPDSLVVPGLVIDLATVVILGLMSIKSPRQTRSVEAGATNEPAVTIPIGSSCEAEPGLAARS